MQSRLANASIHWFMDELTSRIIVETRIRTDRFHIGKILLQSLKDAPEFISQIDGGTGESETNQSVLERSVRCATALRDMGLKKGDVMVLMAPSHIDLAIPMFAGFYLGITVAPVDWLSKDEELKHIFSVNRPKIVFCQKEKQESVENSLKVLALNAAVVTFDKGNDVSSFKAMLDKYADKVPVEDFTAADFDPSETLALLIPTSGTTGMPKSAAISHKNFVIAGPYWWAAFRKFPTPTRMIFIISPLQWLTAASNFVLSVIFRITRLQSSLSLSPDHAYELIDTYKPTLTLFSPTFMTILLSSRENCDLSSFEYILLAGSAVPSELIEKLKKASPAAEVVNCYGMSELSGVGFRPDYPPLGSSGKPLGCFEYQLVCVETQKVITEPNVQGELWVKGPAVFVGYYDNPGVTKDTFSEDGWLKTGDIFYRDDNYNYFFVDRYKLLLKYVNHHISPVEVEDVIRRHPAVSDVAVTGLPHPEFGDLVVACVVKRPGYDVTAQEIKDVVRVSLTDSKQLRGGVIFLDAIPISASTKIDRRKLKVIASQMKRE